MKDSAIKLFGKTINLNLLPDNFASDDSVSVSQHRYSSFATSTSQDSKDESLTRSGHESVIEEETSEIEDEEEKSVKKPEKILACPRCKSMDTKFCYFNNYNVNQPRYFCKKCQRYWTSGGTMRNVPVGSGRRKNKATPLPNFHHIMVSDSMQQGFLIAPSFYPYWVPTCSLGKHPRDETKRSVLIPNEAAIWSTLNHTNTGGTRLFKAFESKGAGTVRSIDTSAMVRQANPAAFSRSINFHERA